MSTSPIVKKPVPNSGLALRTDDFSIRSFSNRRGSNAASVSPVSPVSIASVPIAPVSPVRSRGSVRSVESVQSVESLQSSRRIREPDFKGKRKANSVFHILPREIIQQVLYFADPNTFDSLTLLDRNWHQASQSPLLYAHQLRRCGVAVPDEPAEDSLPLLKRRFAVESRRALFESLLRPQITEIQLICSSPSSAGALPGGDTFKFEFSPKGKYLLALSSSRIFVIYLAGTEIVVKREMKIVKRPIAAAILDDGMVLAVLSSNHVVTVYDLGDQNAKIIKTVPMEDAPRTIALSPGAAVLAAAYEGGIEVYSLHPSALSTDRRAVNCDAVDSLAFSSDGLVLLGTTLHTRTPTTVIISAPFFSADMPVEENLSQMWTTQVLFPRSSRDNSHATLLPEACSDDDENSWTFTYDRVFETFRAVRVDDLRNGHTYFTGPNDGTAISPTTLPAPSPNGGIVAAGFAGKRIYVYGIPCKLDLEPERIGGSGSNGSSSGDRDSTHSQPHTPTGANGSDRGSLNGMAGGHGAGSVNVPQWQVLCDKSRNVLIPGRQVGEVDGLAGLKFVKSEGGERLIAVASGGVGRFEGSDGEDLVVDGGRVVVFDFSRSPRVGDKIVIPIEIGEGQQGLVETLTEEQRDLEAEVLLARRRTVAQRTRQQQAHALPTPSLPNLRPIQTEYVPAQIPTTPTRRPVPSARAVNTNQESPSPGASRRLSTFSPGDEDFSVFEEAVDLPYSHNDPRSRSTLNRAATAAASAHRSFGLPRHAVAGGRVVGPDGRPIREPPPREEDNWVPPPPPYTPRSDNDPPLPLHLLLSLQPRANTVPPAAMLPMDSLPLQLPRAGTFERTRSTFGRAGATMRRGLTDRLSTNMSVGSISSMPMNPENNNSGYLHPQDGNAFSSGESVSAPTSPAVGREESGSGFSAGGGSIYTDLAFNMRRPSTGQLPGSTITRGPYHASSQSLSSTSSMQNMLQQQQQQQQQQGVSPIQQAPIQQQPLQQQLHHPQNPTSASPSSAVVPPMPNLALYHQYQNQQAAQAGGEYLTSPQQPLPPQPLPQSQQAYYAPQAATQQAQRSSHNHLQHPQHPSQLSQLRIPPPTIVQQQLPPPINLIPITGVGILQQQQGQQGPGTPVSPAPSLQSMQQQQQQQQQQGQMQGQHLSPPHTPIPMHIPMQTPPPPQQQQTYHHAPPLQVSHLQQSQSQPQSRPTNPTQAHRSPASRILSRSTSRGRRSVFHSSAFSSSRHTLSLNQTPPVPPVPNIPRTRSPLPPGSAAGGLTGSASTFFGGISVGSIRRAPSRAERSAARNVRDARRRRIEREIENLATSGARDGNTGEGGKGKACVVM